MTDRQLRGLEKTRAGADLSLRAALTLTALAEAKHWPVARSDEIIRIPHATWSNALIQLDAGAFVDVLIPLTTVETRATAARRIREAKAAIRDQRYEHAVALARAALDPVRETCNRPAPTPSRPSPPPPACSPGWKTCRSDPRRTGVGQTPYFPANVLARWGRQQVDAHGHLPSLP
ncbi:hypothetical protein [Streptomyces flaveolus]|uniref:hypothetical protein n=1 Tax=Streptomyces flaveolus TaxID=67297 RepID=UPI0005624ED9|nr:hypothetical protein [Streptomyces flaveolus]